MSKGLFSSYKNWFRYVVLMALNLYVNYNLISVIMVSEHSTVFNILMFVTLVLNLSGVCLLLVMLFADKELIKRHAVTKEPEGLVDNDNFVSWSYLYVCSWITGFQLFMLTGLLAYFF